MRYQFIILILFTSSLNAYVSKKRIPRAWNRLQELQNNEHLTRPERIVGGKDAKEGDFGWQVSIRTEDGRHFCGGSLIEKEWIITAGHCVFEIDYKLKTVAAAVWNVKNPAVSYRVLKTFIHEKFDTKNMENDIALLKLDLKNPIKLDNTRVDFSRTIRIQPKKYLTAGVMCNVTGFGRQKFGGESPRILQVAQVPLQDDAKCDKTMKSILSTFIIFDSNVCAGGGATDACQGDSGGPLVCYDDNEYFLTGITSWGVGCATPGVCGVYTEVSYFAKWIKKIIANEKITMSN